MEDDVRNSFSSHRFSSVSSYDEFMQCNFSQHDPDDPISAYFKKRCENSAKSYFKKHAESDSDSSVGLIDVDNVSVFNDIGECESSGVNAHYVRTSFPINDGNTDVRNTLDKAKFSGVPSNYELDPELQIKKQRFLAQEALMKCNATDESLQEQGEKLKEDNVLRHTNKEPEKHWFQPNYSPNTPRYFNDELSSFGGEDITLAKSDIRYSLPVRELQSQYLKTRQSQYAKKLNSLFKELNLCSVAEDTEFTTQSKDELICKLEEDEKQFKLDNSGVLHNSEISNFSGFSGGELSKWASSSNIKQDLEKKKLSIGQFFNIRSNRISSLVGSTDGSVSERPELSPSTKDVAQTSLTHEQSLPISNVSKLDKPKPRRCISTLDLKQTVDMSRSRYSNDSSTSNSTVMIQNILAEMESGLSGTEIYDKLIKTYGMKKMPKSHKSPLTELVEAQGNRETPKSSKTPKRRENGKARRETDQIVEPIAFRISSPESECKENYPYIERENLGSDRSLSIIRDEKIRKLKGKKGFDASTPKLQYSKKDDRFRGANCKQVLSEKEIWEVPKVSFIQPTPDLNKTETSEEAEKTLTIHSNSTLGLDSNRRDNTIFINDTCTIEDTITAGDLTVLSQRIEEMKDDGVCIVRSTEPEEPVLLTVVQKLADLPKGSVDCSSLTPLLRDQFPELLSTFPTPSSDHSERRTCFTTSNDKAQDTLVSEPGGWVMLPARIGFTEKIFAFAEVKKTVSIPLSNVSKNWLLISIDSLTLYHPNGSKLKGVRRNDEWNVCDFVSLTMKETFIPPESHQQLKVSLTSKIPIKIDSEVKFALKQLLGKEVQTRSVHLRTYSTNPLNSINMIPKDLINFGVLADQCFDQRTFQLTFDGACEMPLMLYVEEDDSCHFFLKPLMPLNNGEWRDDKFLINLREGQKQLIEFLVIFQPNALLNSANKIKDFKASLVLQIGSETDSDGILHRIPIKGSVGFAKFYWNASCSPFVFRVAEKDQKLTRSFPLKNVGSLPIAFSIRIEKGDDSADGKDDVFVAPESFYLSQNEESAINVTFNANCQENYVKRLLTLQIKPNGRAKYDVELIGIISSTEGRPLSRISNASASSKSLSNTESVPVKLLATTHSLSWASVPLEKELRQTFQLKNASSLTVTARITFKHNCGAFRLVNENGERVQKIRKMLKPDCPFALTVEFRPDFLGPHHNALIIETNHLTGKKMISLNGIGGMPNLFIGNVKSDLNGCKMIVLQNSQMNSQIFSNVMEFKNGGRVPGFILIKSSVETLTLCHELAVSPWRCVIPPDSKITIKISQKLKNDDLRKLLTGKDISKVGTLSIIMGDEPSRLRLRKLVESGNVLASERSKLLTASYEGEQELNIKSFDDSPSFENQFMKSLKVVEVAVVVERSSGVCEPTILIDEDETLDEFVTICSAGDTTITSEVTKKNINIHPSGPRKSPVSNKTMFSVESTSSRNKIAQWLETLEYPPKCWS